MKQRKQKRKLSPPRRNPNAVVNVNQNSLARACPVAFLGDYSGYLQTDGYGAYDGLHQVTNVGCLAHARRRFIGRILSIHKCNALPNMLGVNMTSISVNTPEIKISVKSFRMILKYLVMYDLDSLDQSICVV